MSRVVSGRVMRHHKSFDFVPFRLIHDRARELRRHAVLFRSMRVPGRMNETRCCRFWGAVMELICSIGSGSGLRSGASSGF